MRKCTPCNIGYIKREYHTTLLCQPFKDLQTKYMKTYRYVKPRMSKFLEIMHADVKRDYLKLC